VLFHVSVILAGATLEVVDDDADDVLDGDVGLLEPHAATSPASAMMRKRMFMRNGTGSASPIPRAQHARGRINQRRA
jgi:hypothetical protein